MKKNETNSGQEPEQNDVTKLIEEYKKKHLTNSEFEQEKMLEKKVSNKVANSLEDIEKTLSKENDPDLMISYEIIKLPSQGLFYKNRLSEVAIEYMTSRDEDILTTPSLIENGTAFNVLLKRKIKTNGVRPEDLLAGDRNALLLFLRISSYGDDYTVEVTDPRNGRTFKEIIDLSKLRYKENIETPDEDGLFSIEIPMRKKLIKFRLLTNGEDDILFKKAEAIKDAYNEEISQYSTMKLKSSIISIDGNTDRTYIDKFVDAMPALDALKIRKKILDVSPDVDMKYTFKAKDGYEFDAYLSIGIDFFFPRI